MCAACGVRSHTVMPEGEVSFEMITDDYNKTLAQLDSIRARRTKFVCVNDDMRLAPPALQTMLRDFYESFFPLPGMFELPEGTLTDTLSCPDLPLTARAQVYKTLTFTSTPCASTCGGSERCGGPKRSPLRQWPLPLALPSRCGCGDGSSGAGNVRVLVD